MSNKKYQFVDDPEPKAPIEDREDKFIKKSGKFFNIALTIAAGAMVILLIAGIIVRNL